MRSRGGHGSRGAGQPGRGASAAGPQPRSPPIEMSAISVGAVIGTSQGPARRVAAALDGVLADLGFHLEPTDGHAEARRVSVRPLSCDVEDVRIHTDGRVESGPLGPRLESEMGEDGSEICDAKSAVLLTATLATALEDWAPSTSSSAATSVSRLPSAIRSSMRWRSRSAWPSARSAASSPVARAFASPFPTNPPSQLPRARGDGPVGRSARFTPGVVVAASDGHGLGSVGVR